MTFSQFIKLTEDERKQLFYNCAYAHTCKMCGSLICMYNCKGRKTLVKIDKD